MGYNVKRLPSDRRWKLQFIDYRGGKEKIRDIPLSEYSRLGFSPEMTIEEARSRKSQLNDQSHLKAVEAKRAAIARQMTAEERVLNAFLSAEDVQEFEDNVLFARKVDNKLPSIWKAARRVLAELRIKPEDWNYRKGRFYDHFAAQRLSYSYVQKVIMVMNRWGEFQARKYRSYFKPLEFPRGDDKHKIAEAFYEKRPTGQASRQLTPEALDSAESSMKPEWYRWFYISIWFGLRPSEVDRLLLPPGKRSWSIETAETIRGKEIECLSMYQKKLVKLPPDKRFKLIPVICPQQKKAIEFIRGQAFKRPSTARHLATHFGEQVYLYGGRKGFSKLMKKHGQDQVDYSRWMGHTTTDRTETDYEDKSVVHFKPIKRK